MTAKHSSEKNSTTSLLLNKGIMGKRQVFREGHEGCAAGREGHLLTTLQECDHCMHPLTS